MVDYHKLNSLTKKDSYPLPRIDDTLDCLGSAAYFSVVVFFQAISKFPLMTILSSTQFFYTGQSL